MSESILTSTKAALGLADDYTPFDQEIIMFINSTLGTVNQLGIGPPLGLSITDKTATWSDLIGNERRYEGVKSYVYLCVRLLHDPPTVGYVLSAWQKLKEEAEWRLNRAREDITYPLSVVMAGVDESQSVRFDVKAGLPFARQIRITNGKNIWATLEAFEARMHIREERDVTSSLKYDFSPHIIKSFDVDDIVLAWSLTGAQTRELSSGYFNLLVSDIGSVDDRAIQVIFGYLNLLPTTTSA